MVKGWLGLLTMDLSSLIRHAEYFPHDIENGIVPILKSMVKSGNYDTPTKFSEWVVLAMPHKSSIVFEFLGSEAQNEVLRRFKSITPCQIVPITIYNRYR